MQINKWNYKTHKYDKVNIPDKWNVIKTCLNYNKIVNCPHCGKELKFGATYTSFEFHDENGLGYGVCAKCYYKEVKRKLKFYKEELM